MSEPCDRVRSRHRPTVVQHIFGKPGSGGPATALKRLMGSRLAHDFDLVLMPQDRPAGGLNFRLISEYVKTLRRVRPDIVHVRGLGNEGFHAALAAKVAGCPRILVSVHGTVRDIQGEENRVRRWFVSGIAEPSTLSMASHVVTVCRYAAARDFLAGTRATGRLLGVVPNGVPISNRLDTELGQNFRRSLNIPSCDLVMAVVGRLSMEKGYAELARALAEVDFPQMCHLVVAGDGPDSALIRETLPSIERLMVHHVGQLADVNPLLASADLFILASLHENLSNALLEAMAAGVPVVASNVGGNVEVVERGGGRLYHSGDATQLASAVSELLGDDKLRASLGKQARLMVAEHYSVNVMVRALTSTYAIMLDES